MPVLSTRASACTRNAPLQMHRPAVTRVLRRHRRCQAAVQAPQHRFFFDTEANDFDPAEAGMLSVAVIDEASGDYYSALVNPKLVDPSVPITNEATEIHGLQESEVLADGIHPLIAIENVIAFISSKLPPGAQPVIVAHNGFHYHFRVLEWCKQQALQQAAAAAAAAATQQTSTASSSASQSRAGHDAPTANSSGSSHRATRSNSHVNSSSSSSSSAQCSPPAAAGSVVAWPDGWLFQDTLFLLWALKAQTKDLDLQLDGYFTRLPKTHALIDACASLLPPQHPPPTFLPRERALMQATNVGRLLPVLLNLLEPSPQADDDAEQADSPSSHAVGGASSPASPGGSRAMNQFDDMLRRNQDWLTQPWPLNAPNHPTGRFPTWTVSKSAWPLIDLPTSMMDAARQAVKDGGGTKYLLEWYVQKAQPAAAAGPVSTPANKRKKKTKKQ